MAGIFAAFGPDADELSRAVARMAASDPDGGPRRIALPGLELSVQGCDRASLGESGRLVVAFSGYLANWRELVGSVGSGGEPGSDAERVALVLSARGAAVVGELRGEFACLAFDRSSGELLAFRDVSGGRPLHVAVNRRLTCIAPGARQALAGAAVPPEIDADVMIAFLAQRWGVGEATLMRKARRLRPGRLYRVRPPETDLEDIGCFWTPPARDPRLSDPDAAAEELRARVERAVRRTLPGRPFAMTLSGGIDSGAVWGLVRSFARAGIVEAAYGRAYAMVFSGMECDERALIEAALEATGSRAEAVLIESADADSWSAIERYSALSDAPLGATAYQVELLACAADTDGRRTLLTGFGGDEWLSGSWACFPELLRRGRLLDWMVGLARVRPVSAESRVRLVRRLVRSSLAGLRRRQRAAPAPPPAWLHVDRRAGWRERSRAPASAREQVERVLVWQQEGWAAAGVEAVAASLDVELRSPLMDLDVIALGFQAPPEVLLAGRRPKQLMRRALADVLAPAVARRERDTVFDCVVRLPAALRAALEPDDWRLVNARIVDPAELLRLHAAAVSGGRDALDQLAELYAAEIFCRTL